MSLDQSQKDAVLRSMVPLRRPLEIALDILGYPEEMLVNICTITALRSLGIPTRMAAGSARWLVMSQEEQGEAMLEGKKPIPFFGYQFQMVAELHKMMANEYPEGLHCWATDDTGDIYDCSGALIMQDFEETSGTKWPEKRRLPEFITGDPEDLQSHGWFYEEDPQASHLLTLMASNFISCAVANGFSQTLR